MSKETYKIQNDANAGAVTQGYQSIRRPVGDGRWGGGVDAARLNRIAAATEFLSEVMTGRIPVYILKEAIVPSWPGQSDSAIRSNYPELYTIRETYTGSDFPNLLGDVLDRMMLANFNSLGHDWRSYCGTRRPLTDFRTVRVLGFNGAEGQYSKLADNEALKYSTTLDEDNYTYTPDLYALGVKLSFQAIMNDDLGAFDTIPDRLGKGGRRTIEKFVTDLFFDSSGPDATFFSSGNGNLLSSNPDLAIDSLGTAFETLLGFTDADSEPIFVDGVTLVYPPGLHVTAQNLINQLTVDVTTEGGVSGQTLRVNNWIVRNLTPVMNPHIPIVATSNGNTSWALFANPSVGRPAGQVGFVAGYDMPVLYEKASNSARIGGGIDQNAGDFATMERHYKGVLAMGGAVLDPKSAVASNGSNS